jgi:hypothetical protein
VLWAKWLTGKAPWLAQFFNDTNNTGKVAYCVYDLKNGFNAQGLPVWEKSFTVPPGTNYGDMDADIYSVVPEEWCGEMDFQADLIRGGVCGEAPGGHAGYNFGAAFGKLERECQCEPGEWEEISRTEKQYGEWGSCDALREQSILPRPICYECAEWTQEVTYSNGCEKKVAIVDGYEKREAPCQCEELYDGTPSQVRITFMHRDLSTTKYIWRLHSPGYDTLTVEGAGFGPVTFDTSDGDVQYFTTEQPFYGLSVYDCDGNRLHGTASANDTMKLTCEFKEALETECPLPGTCFYNVAGDDGKDRCFEEPGYISWNAQNHLCELKFPGIDRFLWNLNPGQSAEGCLKHHGGED